MFDTQKRKTKRTGGKNQSGPLRKDPNYFRVKIKMYPGSRHPHSHWWISTKTRTNQWMKTLRTRNYRNQLRKWSQNNFQMLRLLIACKTDHYTRFRKSVQGNLKLQKMGRMMRYKMIKASSTDFILNSTKEKSSKIT
jgi:hypothetical protein